jgi:hypothetical protein
MKPWRPLAIVASLCAIGAAPAWSQAAPGLKDNPVEQARSQALINSVDGGGRAFTVKPSGVVIHTQSGMACVPGAEKMRLTGLLVNGDTAVGADVGCDYVIPDGKISVFAMRARGRTLQTLAAAAAAAIGRTFPNARQAAPGPLTATYPGLSTPMAGSFSVTVGGKPAISSVWLAEEGDWLIEERATYPAASRHDPELLAGIQLAMTQKAIHDHAGP